MSKRIVNKPKITLEIKLFLFKLFVFLLFTWSLIFIFISYKKIDTMKKTTLSRGITSRHDATWRPQAISCPFLHNILISLHDLWLDMSHIIHDSHGSYHIHLHIPMNTLCVQGPCIYFIYKSKFIDLVGYWFFWWFGGF